MRLDVKLKPFLDRKSAIIDLGEEGNEYPFLPYANDPQRRIQRLSVIPVDETSHLENHPNGQFYSYEGSLCDIAVQHTFMKEDLKTRKNMWSFEINIPTLDGVLLPVRFKRRLKRGNYSTVLQGQGMWKTEVGGERGDLYVSVTVK